MNSRLLEAVEIFIELGWENATHENVMKLPLGTPAQRKIAVAGLKNGEFGEFKEIKKNTYGFVSYVDVDLEYLAIFAVLIGVDARRASNILIRARDNKVLFDVIASRGKKYAIDFINMACSSKKRSWEHSASFFGKVVVNLVYRLNLEIPQNIEYMKDWSVYMAKSMGLNSLIRHNETYLPDFQMMKQRFVEHIITGVSVNSAGTGPFGEILPKGVEMGLIKREDGIEYAFSLLDSSIRPRDRKVWIEVLEQLNITDEELFSQMELLIPIIATGYNVAIEKLSPRLIKLASNDELIELLIASFSAKTKKGKVLILKSALDRPCPKDTDNIVPWLNMLVSDKDSTISKKANTLMDKWNVQEEIDKNIETEIQGLWRETPPLWESPDFELLEVSGEALTELLSELINRTESVNDVVCEKFLALANKIAYKDSEECRVSLSGIKRNTSTFLTNILCWVNGEIPKYGFDDDKRIFSVLYARDIAVSMSLDKIPCILSTPSKIDLTINFLDLINRILKYKELGLPVLESDLFLALLRVDSSTITKESLKKIKKLDVNILLQNGEYMDINAALAIQKYAENPLEQKGFFGNDYNEQKQYLLNYIEKAFAGFPKRFESYTAIDSLFSVMPYLDDFGLRAVRWNDVVYHEKGLILRQVARRANPLPPGATINILAAQRSSTHHALEDSILAVKEAWERGLLLPNVADINFLDWSDGKLYNIASLANAFDWIIREGLLSVVWPILDDILKASLKSVRLVSGTVEVLDLILEFLPEVFFAIEKGLVDKSALDLIGVRELSNRKGSSKAIATAKKIVEQLPELKISSTEKDKSLVMEIPFDEIWKIVDSNSVIIDDKIKITINEVKRGSNEKLLQFNLVLPDIDDIFQECHVWTYGLENEGQTIFTRKSDGKQVWLHWDVNEKKMVVCDNRDWINNTKNTLDRNHATPLTITFYTMLIGTLAQGNMGKWYKPNFLIEKIETGEIDSELIKIVTEKLLENEEVSPAKLVRVLERDINLLPTLWPMLTESIKKASEITEETGKPPIWINRILNISLRYTPYLKEAMNRGYITKDDSEIVSLAKIANLKLKSASVSKARELLKMIDC